jgi:hypothetical protein
VPLRSCVTSVISIDDPPKMTKSELKSVNLYCQIHKFSLACTPKVREVVIIFIGGLGSEHWWLEMWIPYWWIWVLLNSNVLLVVLVWVPEYCHEEWGWKDGGVIGVLRAASLRIYLVLSAGRAKGMLVAAIVVSCSAACSFSISEFFTSAHQ